MPKILGISGSPRRGGNTEILLDRALEGASRAGAIAEKIILNELYLTPCQGCYDRCGKKGACVVKDDMRLIYRKLDEADALVIASPIYFGSVSAQLKIMIDRCNSYWVRKYLSKMPIPKKKKRKGVFLCCAAGKRVAFFENAKSIVRFFFGTLGIEYYGDIFCGGVVDAGEITKRRRELKMAFELGRKLIGKSLE